MDIRGPYRASNAPCCLDLLRGHLRLSIGVLFGLDSRPHPRIAVATIFLWPLAAVAVLYVIYRVFGVHPELLIYIAAFVGVIAIAMIWWWHVGNNKL
jgi:hypothetical protein